MPSIAIKDSPPLKLATPAIQRPKGVNTTAMAQCQLHCGEDSNCDNYSWNISQSANSGACVWSGNVTSVRKIGGGLSTV